MPDIQCSRCSEENPQLDAPPFRDELGQRIHQSICQNCWDEWLFRQMQLINHYALDVREPEARDFLRKNVRAFLFGEGEPDRIETGPGRPQGPSGNPES